MDKAYFITNGKGQSAVEYALSMIIFVLILFGLTNITLYAYNWMALQYTANLSARATSIGDSPFTGIDRQKEVERNIRSFAFKFGIKDVQITFVDEADGHTLGQGEEFFRMHLTSQFEPPFLKLPFFLNSWPVHASAMIRNEPW